MPNPEQPKSVEEIMDFIGQFTQKGYWHITDDCDFLTLDWGVCNCKSDEIEKSIREVIETYGNTRAKMERERIINIVGGMLKPKSTVEIQLNTNVVPIEKLEPFRDVVINHTLTDLLEALNPPTL